MVEEMKISQVVAVSQNGVIGKDNDLIWNLPNDLKRFKSITMGRCMLMGRKCFESIGKPLNGRISIILTKNKDYSIKFTNNVFIVHSIEEGIELAKNLGEKELMIIGGGEIYKKTLDIADKIYYTKVLSYFEGDTFYPKIEVMNWEVSEETKINSVNGEFIDHIFYTFKRR